MMRRFLVTVAAAAMVAALIPSTAGAQTAKPVTITGKLLDHACFLVIGAQPSRDAELTKCSVTGSQKGERLALLTPGGVMYFIRGPLAENNNAKLVPYIAKVIQLTGIVTSVDAKVESTAEAAAIEAASAGTGTLSAVTAQIDATVDTRRNPVSENEVINAPPPRSPNYREGDPRSGNHFYIDATSGLDIVTKTKFS